MIGRTLVAVAVLALTVTAASAATTGKVCIPDRDAQTRILLCPPDEPHSLWYYYVVSVGAVKNPLLPVKNETSRQMIDRALWRAGY